MDAKTARAYIKQFADHTSPRKGLSEVKFANGDVVKFEGMTDEEDIRVAGGLLEIEAEAAARTLKRRGARGRN